MGLGAAPPPPAAAILQIGAKQIKLPAEPLQLACGYDRAQQPLAAVRWPDADDESARVSTPTPLHLWDGQSAALVAVIDEATGEPLRVLCSALSGTVDQFGGVLSCAADGQLWQCGANGVARPCFGHPPTSSCLPQPPITFVKIACGGSHSLAASADGALFAWGSNTRGQLGTGDDVDRAEPAQVSLARASAGAPPSSSARAPSSAVLRIAAGVAHSAAVTTAGALFAWGDGGDGRLGLSDASFRRRTVPTALPPPPPPSAADLNRRRSTLMGSLRTAALVSGRMAASAKSGAKSGAKPQAGPPGSAVGASQELPTSPRGPWLNADKAVHDAARGIAPAGATDEGSSQKLAARRLSMTRPAAGDIEDTWRQPACAERHSACVSAAGQLFTWGRAEHGRLGHGRPYADQDAPKLVTSLKGLEIVEVALGRAHSIAITRNGRVYAWGSSEHGQCGPTNPRLEGGIPRPLFAPQLLLASAAGDRTVLCSHLNLPPPPTVHSAAWLRYTAATPAEAGEAGEAAGADADGGASAGNGGKRSAASHVWHRVGHTRKSLALSMFTEAGKAQALSQAEQEELHRRRMARWSHGVALWKRALRLLAHERPTLWRVAQLHACLGERPDNLRMVAGWYKELTAHSPRSIVELRSGASDGPPPLSPAPPRKAGRESHGARDYYFGPDARRLGGGGAAEGRGITTQAAASGPKLVDGLLATCPARSTMQKDEGDEGAVADGDEVEAGCFDPTAQRLEALLGMMPQYDSQAARALHGLHGLRAEDERPQERYAPPPPPALSAASAARSRAAPPSATQHRAAPPPPMSSGMSSKAAVPPRHRAPPSAAAARGGAAAAAHTAQAEAIAARAAASAAKHASSRIVAADASPILTALLSPRTFMPVSYPKPACIDVSRLEHGVWSADFSWARGVAVAAGNTVDASNGPASVGDLQDVLSLPTAKHTPSRLTLSVGAAAPSHAAIPSASVAAATPRAAPLFKGSALKAARMFIAEAQREEQPASAALPFGGRTKTYLDIETAWPTPPPSRYNPVRVGAPRQPVFDFGAGGVLKRTSATNASGTDGNVGPGSYSTRDVGAKAKHRPSTFIVGDPPALSFHQPSPAPGDFELPPHGNVAPCYSFARGKSGREAVGGSVSLGASTGMMTWKALEPALVRAGALDPPAEPSALERARTEAQAQAKYQ